MARTLKAPKSEKKEQSKSRKLNATDYKKPKHKKKWN